MGTYRAQCDTAYLVPNGQGRYSPVTADAQVGEKAKDSYGAYSEWV